MDETEDFFVQVEKSLRIKIPHNVKLHLALSGFGNSVSLADITDKDIQDMELFAKTDLKEIVPNWNEYLGVFKEKIDSFRFFSGEKVLIYKMKEFAQKIRKDVEKDNNITSTSFSRAANARSINNDNKKKLDDRGDDSEQVQPRIQHDNLVEEVGMLRQVVKTGILNRIKSLKKEDHRICMEPFRDHEFIVKLDQLDNVYSNIKCPICEKEIKESNKILRKYLKKIRESGEEGSFIRGEKLYRNNIGYTAEEILVFEKSIESTDFPKPTSAPETPSKPLAERTKKEKSESDKSTKKTEEETKEEKKKNTTTRNIESSFTQSRPETRERKNSAKEIKTRSTQRNATKTAEHAFNDVQSEKHSEKQNANIVIVTDVQVHPPTINKRNQDSLSSMDASTDTEQKKERLIQNDFRDEANSLLPHNALIGERDGERVGEQVGEPRTRLRRIFPRIAQTNFDDIITIPESEPLNKGPSKRRKIDESDELESEEKENQGENLENSSSDDSKPLQFFLKSRGCKETSSSAKQGKRSLEESIHLRKIDENRKWNRNKYTRASRNRRRRENISTKTKQYQLLITNYVEHLDQIEFVMKENDDLKKILFQEIPELNTTDTESNIPVFLKILNKAAQQNMKLTKNNKFSDDLLQFSVYLFIIGGRLLYESLYANLKKSLPSVSTVTRTIASTNNFEEGVLRFRELNEFLEKRKLPKIIWISEDATRITGRIQYNPTSDTLGQVLLEKNTNIDETNNATCSKFGNENICDEEDDIFSIDVQGKDFDSDDSVRDRDYFPSDASSDDEAERTEISKDLNEEVIEQLKHNRDEAIEDETEESKSNDVEDTPKKLVRKRMRNPESWKKNKRKKNRNLGKEYLTVKGKKVARKMMGATCSEKCRIKCSTRLNDSKRQEIFDYYWKLGDINLQRNFVNSCMSEINPTYRNSKPGSTRSKNYKYSFLIDDAGVQVCKTFFKNTLGINNRTIFTTTKKKDHQGIIERDRRGTHTQHKKIPDNIKSDILRHIESFPRVNSHYCRSRTNKEYLEGSLNIRIMYRLYIQQCEDSGKDYAKYGTYAHIFNTETNIAFHVPKKDQCYLCENYKNATEESKVNLQEKYDNHLIEKTQSRLEKNRDVENPNNSVYCYDLQAVLPTPCGDVNAFYYRSKLSTLNFTIFDLKNKRGYCYLWHEAIAKRGANEICSCVYKFITEHRDRNDIIFYSDNCVGQNKNKFIFGMYLYCVQHFEDIHSISHKFLIVGHTQNEGDSMHATIEKEKKRMLKSGPVYIPAQWAMIIRSAKKHGHPYNLEEISTFDQGNQGYFKKFVSKIGNNFNRNVDNEIVVWRDVKVLRFEKDHPYTIFYKTSYANNDFKQICVKKKNLRGNNAISNLEITQAYTNPQFR
ncbi:unnamed protein product [Phaedon cochleariae]|uniref:DUF7869 domain-containing protein n=1 Tax=Phaedon cochleariae TaxID=80249 RepID=A0A9P0GRT2_PHACE|nr:unnamed protein product [Phaedon cochleariae]